MTTTATERPTWRDVNIDLLAKKMFGAHGNHSDAYMDTNWPMISLSEGSRWTRAATAAVDELIDRPEREFQARLSEVLKGDTVRMEMADGTLVADTVQAIAWIEAKAQEPRPAHAGSWTPASASDWLPEHA